MITLSHPLIFIRHGQTDWNKEGRLQGGQDIPINDTGAWQAKRNGARLKSVFEDEDFALSDFAFVASPLQRCIRTMGLVRKELSLDPESGFAIEPLLSEITFGEWEGFTYPELEAAHGDIVAAREADKWNAVPPGGESYAMLTDRVAPWLLGLDGPTIAVSHGGVSRAVRGLLLDLPGEEAASLDVPQDKLYLFVDGQGYWL